MENITVSLFIPVYNEGKTFKKNVLEVIDILTRLKLSFELFIVDDSSTDLSGDVGKKIADTHKNVYYLRYNDGPSRRENLALSFRKAHGNIIAFIDADLSTNMNDFGRLIEEIKKGADIAIGNRYSINSHLKRRITRRFISILFNKFIRLYFDSKIYDHQCGFKSFNKKILYNLLDEMGYDNAHKRKFFWDTELLLRAQKKSYKIFEIPVEWHESDKSRFYFFQEITLVPYMILLKRRIGSVRIK